MMILLLTVMIAMVITIRMVDNKGLTLRQPTNPCLREADQSLAGTSGPKYFVKSVHRNLFKADKYSLIIMYQNK